MKLVVDANMIIAALIKSGAARMKDDIKDIPYVACFLAKKCDAIWTNDTDFWGKPGIKAVDTADLLKHIQ